MRKINFLFAIILVSLVLLSVASFTFAQTTKKTLELPEFKSIYVNSNYTVYVKQSNKQEVTVEALTEIWELTTVKVENGVLLVNVERKPDNPNKSIWSKIDDIKIRPTMKIMVSVKNLNELQVNGGGKIISENSIAADYISLAVSGSGGIDLDLKGNNVKTEISGSGNVTLKGYASTNDIVMSGSGSLNSYACELENAKVKMSGSGVCELSASASLDATVLGSGSVKHKGNTKSVTKKVYGSGAVDRAY
ncbi:MAG TPA: head GIN domain-containing protein [Cyclobacteriaceae bacterium]|nr:head GIN domain-containing protein [Cyclobacteriaceae bacterium]